LYPGSIKDNITLGFSSAEYSAIKDYRAIMELVGWVPERLEDSIGELAEDELELKRLSIARALWRGPSGLVVSDLDKSVDGQRRTSLIKLVNRLSDMPISMVFITTEQAINVGAWSQVLEISSIVEAMMATDQEGLK
jgi:ABC-type antimicrobial peptide transport system ATPase subunit